MALTLVGMTSECVWKYITMDHNASDQVARAFQHNLHSTSYLGFGASTCSQKR